MHLCGQFHFEFSYTVLNLTSPNFGKIHYLDFTDDSNTKGQSTHFQQQRSKANQEIRLVTLLYTIYVMHGTVLLCYTSYLCKSANFLK